jgi:hypothetical protein
MEINRINIPKVPDVRVGKKMPKPFARPSITIGAGTRERREWVTCKIIDIRPGDILPGVGLVSTVSEKLDTEAKSWTVTVTGGLDQTRVYQGNETVWAFTARAIEGR